MGENPKQKPAAESRSLWTMAEARASCRPGKEPAIILWGCLSRNERPEPAAGPPDADRPYPANRPARRHRRGLRRRGRAGRQYGGRVAVGAAVGPAAG